jgi:uncharacterized LabA/DUF88 family protein
VRVNVYVDGFNLYHRALRSARAPDGSTYKWLDLETLAGHVLSNPDYSIGRIRYFTARVRALPGDPQAPLRQQMYLRALATLSSVTVHFGFFQKSQKKMQLVRPLPDGTTMVKVHKFEEKGSDVNLATYLLLDAFQNDYDGAAVITNDSDLAEPIRIVRDILAKRVEVLDPCGDGRTSAELAKVATFYKAGPARCDLGEPVSGHADRREGDVPQAGGVVAGRAPAGGSRAGHVTAAMLVAPLR